MSVNYGDTKDIDLFQLARLFADTGGEDLTTDVSRLGAVVRGSTRIVWASEGGALVGFGAALSDGARSGFVTDVRVRPGWTGRGIEQALVDRLLGSEPGVTFVVRATSSTAATLTALGFEPTADVVHVRRT